jgi:hypothetical protein
VTRERTKLSAVHVAFGFAAESVAGSDRGAQHVARRDLGDLQAFPEGGRVRSLAGTRHAHDYDPHRLPPIAFLALPR